MLTQEVIIFFTVLIVSMLGVYTIFLYWTLCIIQWFQNKKYDNISVTKTELKSWISKINNERRF